MIIQLLVAIVSGMAYSPGELFTRVQSVAVMELDLPRDTACTDGVFRVTGKELLRLKGPSLNGMLDFPCLQKAALGGGKSALVFANIRDNNARIELAVQKFECYYRSGDSLKTDSRCQNIQTAQKYCVDDYNLTGCDIVCKILLRENQDSSCLVRYNRAPLRK